MSSQQRVLLAIALCATIYVLFELFLGPRPPPPGRDDTSPIAAQTEVEPIAATEPARSDAHTEGGQAAESARHDAVEHRVENDLLALRLTTANSTEQGIVGGAELLSDQFQGHETALDAMQLDGASTLAISFADEATDFRIPVGATFEALETTSRGMTLGYRTADVEVLERFELLEGYESRLSIEVRNLGASEQRHRMKVRVRVGKGDSQYDVHRGICRTHEDLEEEDDLDDGPVHYGGPILWGGVDTKYFVTAIVPSEPVASCEIRAGDDGKTLITSLVTDVVKLAPGATRTYELGVYLGPKELERLQEFSAVAVSDAKLQEAIDWGVFGGLSEALGRFLLGLLRWLFGLVQSWGWAIVLLTVLVKAVTLPLTLKQMHSMKRMKEIQPEMQRIKDKYAGDKVKQGQEIQALFSRSGVNPLAGCLPMLVQLPIWFALYSMLLTAVELVHEPFLWLPDLTKPDPWFALPLSLGALMVVQNRMMPVQDEAQAKMMRWFMPIMFTMFMLFLPSGLALYIFTNIVLSVIQTAIQMRTTGQPAATPAP